MTTILLTAYAAVATLVAVYFALLWGASHQALKHTLTALYDAKDFRDILRLRQEIMRTLK